MFLGEKSLTDHDLLVGVDHAEHLGHVPRGDHVVLDGSAGEDDEVGQVVLVANLERLEAVADVWAAGVVLGVDEVDHVLEGEALRVRDLYLPLLTREQRLW